jgi:hypothetical protein
MPFVELYIEDVLMDLPDDISIEVDYAIAEIGNFETRNGFRSVNFDLPRTATNKLVLENADIINNLTIRPYRRLKCRLYVDGIDQLIRFADIESTQDNFNIRVYGGLTGFFELIKKKNITDLSYLPALAHEQNLTNVIASRINSTGYIYPLIDFHADSPNNIINNNNNNFDIRYCFPCLFIDDLLREIVGDAGYSLQNNINLFDIQYQSAKSLFVPSFENPQYFNANSSTDIANIQSSNFSNPLYYASPVLQTRVGLDIKNEAGTFTTDGAFTTYPITFTGVIYYYEIPVSGKYTFTLKGNGAQTLPVAALILKKNGTNLDEVAGLQSMVGPPTWDVTVQYTVNAVAGEQYVAFFASLTFFNIAQADFSYMSNVLNFRQIQSDFKQGDFIKQYLQMYCAIIQVNEFTKLVQINKFDDLINNIGLSVDWSDKIDYIDEPEITYSLDDYAQVNTLTYTDDDSVIKPAGTDGEILIDDETLDGTNEFIELDYAATELVTRLEGLQIPNIKIWTTDIQDSVPVTEITEEVEPRILLLERVAGSVDYIDGTTTTNVTTNLPVTWFIRTDKTYNLGFANSLIPSYYNTLQRVLDRTKIVNVNVRLTPLDINQLDFLKPVYIDKFNSYFYISKISGFDSTKVDSVEVELVKLK